MKDDGYYFSQINCKEHRCDYCPRNAIRKTLVEVEENFSLIKLEVCTCEVHSEGIVERLIIERRMTRGEDYEDTKQND